MEQKKYSPKVIEAIKNSIKLWTWLGKTGKQKWQWPEWEINGGMYPEQQAGCFLCSINEICCDDCPLCAEEGDKLNCSDYAFGDWEGATTVADRKKYAKQFAEELRALLPPEPDKNPKAKFAVGEIIVMNCSCPHHKGKLGIIEDIGEMTYTIRPLDSTDALDFDMRSILKREIPQVRKGDKVRVLQYANPSKALSQWEEKAGEVGEVIGVDGKSVLVHFDDGASWWYEPKHFEIVIATPKAKPKKAAKKEKKQLKYKVGDTVMFLVDVDTRAKRFDVGTVNKLWSYKPWIVPYPYEIKFADGRIDSWFAEAALTTPRAIDRVYIAGALSTLPDGKKEDRSPSKVVIDYIKNASEMCYKAAEVRTEGFSPYVPALDFLLGLVHGGFNEEHYRGASMSFLEVCDAVLIVSHSKGVDKELERARELGIPVVNNIEELLDLREKLS